VMLVNYDSMSTFIQYAILCDRYAVYNQFPLETITLFSYLKKAVKIPTFLITYEEGCP
jgi:hypothetical protein